MIDRLGRNITYLRISGNGVLLPQLGKALREAAVNRLNLSLDTLDSEKYSYITRIGNLENFMMGLDAAFEAGFEKIKINAVLIDGFNSQAGRNMNEIGG